MLIELSQADDPRLVDYTGLTDVALRTQVEEPAGLYMAESTNVIARAVAAGHRPRSVLVAPKWLATLAPVLRAAGGQADGGDIPVFVAPEPLLQQITGFHLHRGALAAMVRPQLATVEDVLSRARQGRGARRVAILEGLVDHTNVGAAFRSAAALGIDAVLVTPTCADPLYRRSVRVSMGGVFQVPWTRIGPWPNLEVLHAAGFTVAALALSPTAVTLDEFVASGVLEKKVAFVFGAEGDGLARHTIATCDQVVRIPMAGEVDSLNVAAAAAVTFWATRPAGGTD
ncbi:TrmH family RNA methyltransferase [Buchananella hordeovulneris]|uniref:TrmH family RNA methyltransferase n=1 Tax=Buchananella hordeovulneris TaxID=52770 RepID=UPI000F5EB9C2|nr:RNA methyltransferase [Buchananella hordeovulneris]RRD44161.1 RNA methyltransferase [Buchananella hordeovulneris]